MQQRGSFGASMEGGDDGDQGAVPPSRGRPTSKLKVLGRSHAMREEQSPPREPSSGDDYQPPGGHLQSPPTVVLSPSPADEDDSTIGRISGNGSPATLVATPNSRCSPHCENNGACERLHPAESDLPSSPVFVNGKSGPTPDKVQNNKSSQVGLKGKKYCDCLNQNCIKCLKDKGGNNNNHSNTNNNVMGGPNMLHVNKTRGKLKQQSSSQTSLSFESSTGNSPCLSRDGSSECYTDTTGVDLEQFIPETLNRNPKDRALMLRIEEELVNLANDKFQTHYKFPPMSSYHRMLVHRCAAYFGMDHNIEQSGKCVVVNKTKNTRIPDVRFKEHIKEMFNDEPPRRSILKRDSNSIEDYCFKSPERGYSLEGRRSKSFEEREEEYERARRRIFRGELHDGSSEDFGWSDMQAWSSTDSEYARYRLQPPEFQSRQLRRLLKVHSEETEQSMRPCVAKSYSFGGYGGSVSILTRGDSIMSTHSAPGARLLTKQDSGASSVSWRLSPSSSGYKSQSQMSESVTPSPTSTPHPPGESNGSDDHRGNKGGNPVLWAVTDLSNVPKGSIIINPETGKPFKNEDGTIYYFDPCKPPHQLLPPPPPPESPPRLAEKDERPLTPQKDKTPTSSPKHEKRPPPKPSPTKSKSSFTNTATSPSLPFSPPLSSSSSVGIPMSRSYPYLQVVNSCENISNLPQQHFPNYNNPPAEGNVPVYSQPQSYIVYTAPYGVPVQQQYDSRMDQGSMPDLSTTFYVPEGAAPPPAQTITYQTQPPTTFWNQQPVSFYPNTPQPPSQTPPQRFSVQMPPQGQPAYMPAGYPATMNYVTQQAGHQAQNPEVVSMYPNQPVQMVYPPNQASGAVIYQNQPSLIYAHNPALYPAAAYQPQTMPGAYPQSTPTPNSGASSVPTTPFGANNSDGFVQLTQSMHQMNLGPPQASTLRGFVPVNTKCPQQFDPRRGSLTKPPPNFAKQPRSFLMCSSQSSTGTNSPAATVVAAGYCPQSAGAPGQYRTPPPSTPPTPQFVFHQPGYPMAPRLFRQMSGERGPTPGTAKSSRSPTPASDITHFERQRFTFPPNFYQGMPMPYIVQSDPRLVGRGQPNVYRQTPPVVQAKQTNTQSSENRSHNNNKNRKSKNKTGGLPPTGK